MKYLSIIFSFIMLFLSPLAISEEETLALTPEQIQYLEEIKKMWDTLEHRQGEVVLSNDVATLKVPDNFYYLSPADAEKILVGLWGNPPGAGEGTLGMLFPASSTPFEDESWGVTIEYEEEGYVSDEDADEIDYDELLAQMQAMTKEASQARVRQGYEAVELVGWAAKPFYDPASHKLHWAKEIKFGDQPNNTLNYHIRVLGRKGVLILNFIADMSQKETIDNNIETVLALADFNEGLRYEDFDPSIDKVAAYGIGALVAGKVMAKTGFLAALLIFLKKFGVLIAIGVVALWGKFFRRKTA